MTGRLRMASFLVLGAAMLGVLAAPIANAQERKRGLLHDRFQIRGGVYFAFNLDSSVEIDVDGVGDEVDFEDDLGLDATDVQPFVDFLFRFNPRRANHQ